MAVIRRGSAVSKRLNILLFGAKFSGKTSLAMQAAYLKTPEGKPFKLLVFDTESGGTDEAIDEVVKNGVNPDDILVIYTQSQSEIKSYISKVANNEDIVMIDENGEEMYDDDGTPIVYLDGEGKPFRADCIIVDSISVLKITTQQSMLDLSRKRNKIKAEKSGATGDEKFVAIANSGLELRDYNQMNFSGQDFVLSLMACGVHVIMTAREVDEKMTVRDGDKTTSVSTGKKVYDGLKGADYNCKTIMHLYSDEDTGEIFAHVEKDRTKVHSLGEVIADPSLLDYQVIIDDNVNRKNFVLKNDLDKAVETDQKLFEKQMLGADYVPEEKSIPTVGEADELRAAINAALKKLAPPAKKAMKTKIEAAGLPTDLKAITDPEILSKILAIVTE